MKLKYDEEHKRIFKMRDVQNDDKTSINSFIYPHSRKWAYIQRVQRMF